MNWFSKIRELAGHEYERYLPTAFDESLTLLEKVNKVIETLNQIVLGVNTVAEYVDGHVDTQNEKITQLRDDFEILKDWLENEGLEERTEQVLNEWFDNGRLAQIINNDVFNMKTDKVVFEQFVLSTTTQLEQKGSLNRQKQGGSFVDKINELNTVKGVGLIKQDNGFDIVVLLKNPERGGFQYQFRKNHDGLVLLDSILGGRYANTEIENKLVDLKGTFTTTSSVAYTVTPDDYFTFTFTGSGFDFRTLTGYRSGVWEFDVEKIGKKTIDTYTSTQSDVTTTINIFKDLPYGSYRVKATFKGKSDFSTETIETRGWIYNYLANPILVDSSYRVLENKVNLSDRTINDYAITIRKTDLSTPMTWTPVHNGVTGVSVANSMKFYVDGVLITDQDITAIKSQYDIKKVELIQFFRGRNGNSEIDLTEQTLKHTINSDGVLAINNTVKFIEDCTIGNAYLNMLGANQNIFDKLYLNNKQIIPLSGGFSESMNLSDDVSSAAFVGTYQPGRYVGLGVDSLSFAEASGAHLKPDVLPVHLTFREDGVAKFYVKAIETNGTVLKGDILSNISRYAPTYGVSFPNDELMTIL